MTSCRLKGVIAPNLTPFNDDLSLAVDLYVRLGAALLEHPCVALAPFGTTGEALSVANDERIAAVRAMVDAGVDPARLIPGTGLANLPETATLSQAMLDLGCLAVMTLPPFYFKGVCDDGLFAYFSELIARIDRPRCRIFLYHIPQISGVGLSIALVRRLKRAFPSQIVGIKDSSGDDDNTLALLDIDDLVVYSGSELPILQTMARGSPGCISATANLNGADIAKTITLVHDARIDAAQALHARVRQIRLIFQEYAPIAAQKRLLAAATGEARWANVRPPLVAMDEARGEELLTRLGSNFAAHLKAFADRLAT